jgi:ribose transport system substrate-binding protein
MRKHLWSILGLVVILSMIAAQCAPAPPPPPPPTAAPTVAPAAPTAAPAAKTELTFAWIPKALNNPVFELGKVGAETKAKELSEKGPIKVNLFYTGSTASDIAEQARVVEDVIAKKVDGIGISCNEAAGCKTVIDKAVDAGIPVMTWDSDSPDSKRFTYLGVSNYEGGKAAGDLLVRAMGKTGKVALLTGVPGAPNLEQRISGFKDFMKDYPDIEIVTTVACNDDINKGVQVVEEAMTAHPDLTGWFFVGLWPLFAKEGSMKQWEAAAQAGKIKTVAFDTLPVELDFMKKGMLQGLVGQKYWGWGYDTVQMMYDYIVNGKKFDPKWTDSGMDIVTPANVDVMADMWKTMDFTKVLPPPFPEAAPAAAAAPAVVTADKVKILVVGKSVHPYWSNVEKGVRAAAKELGLKDEQAVFFVPPKEDVAAQITTIETYLAQGVTGIAVAPSDPAALEPTFKKAAAAGVWVTTLDTPPVKDSVSLVYIGTDNTAAGMEAGKVMKTLLPDGGKVGIGRGSDTALNALQRTDGFKKAIEGTNITALDPVNDKEDAARALELASGVINANPDLAGAFGVYAYNGPAWASAVKEAGKVGKIKVVGFDAGPDIINPIIEGVVNATVAQREFNQGAFSVKLQLLLATKGKDAAFTEMNVKEGIIDTGVDVISLKGDIPGTVGLADYAKQLDAKGIPYEWKLPEGLAPAAAPAGPKPKLQIIWFTWQPCQALGELVKKYPDADVEVRCVPIARWHDDIFTDFAAKGGADLVVLDSQYIGEAVVGGHVAELTDWMKTNIKVDDYVPAALSAYGEYPLGSGHYYGVALEADAMMLVYRKDLYEDPTVQAAYKAKTGQDLRVPQSWTELLAQAQFFKGSEFVPNGYSAIWMGKGGYDEISTQVNQIFWSFGGELWDPKTYKIEGVLNSDTNVKALTFAADLFKTSPEGAGNFSFSEMTDALCNGSTAIGNVWFAFGAAFVNKEGCKFSDKLGFGVVPGEVKHVISLGGQGVSLSSYTKDKEAALKLLAWLQSDDIQLEWAKLGQFPARKSIMSNPIFLNATPYNKSFAESYLLVKDFWNLPEYNAMLQAEQEYLSLAVTGQMDPKDALDEIAKRQQAILDKAYPGGPPK